MTYSFSDFGEKLTGHSGILQLMDDLGRPLPEGLTPYRLGGGNPAQVPEVIALYRSAMKTLWLKIRGLKTLFLFMMLHRDGYSLSKLLQNFFLQNTVGR